LIEIEIFAFRMLNQVRCALAFYGIHDKRECAFRIETKNEENDDDDDRPLSMPME